MAWVLMRYLVEYYGKNKFRDEELNGPYYLVVCGSDLDEASKKTVNQMVLPGIAGLSNRVWNVKINDPCNKIRQIMEEGNYLIDFDTGRLEKKI